MSKDKKRKSVQSFVIYQNLPEKFEQKMNQALESIEDSPTGKLIDVKFSFGSDENSNYFCAIILYEYEQE